jgi:hypothetical protein
MNVENCGKRGERSMSFVFLKIKIKALAAEAAIIKREKRRLPRRL